MDRRSFLKIGGVAAAAGLTGACGQAAQKIIPYVVPPDDGVNPVEGWFFATTCRMCEAGCGIMVRTVEGRAKKVEGNPNHPVNRGGVCARGQAAVQQLYHPERIKTPLIRKKGTKGTNSFTPISWDEALALLADKMKNSIGKGSFAMVADPSDITAAVTNRVLNKLGSNDFVAPNIRGIETSLAASSMFSEEFSLPYYDMTQASFVLLLGADIFENSVSPVHYSWAFGQMRRGDPTHRGVLMYVGPRLSMTAATADRYIAARHGTLGILTLGLAREVLDKAENEGMLKFVPHPTLVKWFDALEKYSPSFTSVRTGVSERDIKELARQFITHQPAVVIPGDDVAGHSNGMEAMKAVAFLNMILREVARQKGALKTPGLPYADRGLFKRMRDVIGAPITVKEFQATADIIKKSSEGKMAFGMVFNTNPVHSLPGFLKTGEALSRVGFLVAFDTFLNDTTMYADLVLPDHHFLESWSIQVPDYPHGVPMVNAQQPVVRPLYDTMPAGDAILKAATLAGIDIGFDSQESMIQKMIADFRAEWPEAPPAYENKQVWEFLLQKGGWWPENPADELEPAPSTDQLWNVTAELDVVDPVFAGDSESGFHLLPYETVHIGDGRTANLAWLLEMPEPMTTLSWGMWVEINPRKAEELGIHAGDILKISSPYGSIEAPAYLYPGIGPDTVAVPFGFGHVSFGKDASGRGANAMELLGSFHVLGASGSLAWRGIKVKLEKTGRRAKMVREGHPKGEYEGEVFQL